MVRYELDRMTWYWQASYYTLILAKYWLFVQQVTANQAPALVLKLSSHSNFIFLTGNVRQKCMNQCYNLGFITGRAEYNPLIAAISLYSIWVKQEIMVCLKCFHYIRSNFKFIGKIFMANFIRFTMVNLFAGCEANQFG